MTDSEYKHNLERLKEIESIVKDPECNIDEIDAIVKESQKLIQECRSYLLELQNVLGRFNS